MRKYQPIWLALKKDLSVSISAPTHTHGRILQGVRKEKTKDLGWLYKESEIYKKHGIKEKSNGTKLTLKLVPITEISVHTL